MFSIQSRAVYTGLRENVPLFEQRTNIIVYNLQLNKIVLCKHVNNQNTIACFKKFSSRIGHDQNDVAVIWHIKFM